MENIDEIKYLTVKGKKILCVGEVVGYCFGSIDNHVYTIALYEEVVEWANESELDL